MRIILLAFFFLFLLLYLSCGHNVDCNYSSKLQPSHKCNYGCLMYSWILQHTPQYPQLVVCFFGCFFLFVCLLVFFFLQFCLFVFKAELSLSIGISIYVTVYRKTGHNAAPFKKFFLALTELLASRY